MCSDSFDFSVTGDRVIIKTQYPLNLGDFSLEVLSYLGQISVDVHFFEVKILPVNDDDSTRRGLLRVGAADGGLGRELKLREVLGDYKMVAQLLAYTTAPSVTIELDFTPLPKPEEESEDSYLEEEYYLPREITCATSPHQLLILSYLPEEDKTLAAWLGVNHILDESLFVTTQICQFMRYIGQRNWCLMSIVPQLTEMATPIKFFDLSNAYPVGSELTSGLLGDYIAPELAYGQQPINELMSTYTTGALLYHAIHSHPVTQYQDLDREIPIEPIAQIYQILKIALSPVAAERFSLSQFLNLLVDIRKTLNQRRTHWHTASGSTVGLSTRRLHNEDSYGIRQRQIGDYQTMIIAAVADGMGGMSQGELASQLAIEVVLDTPYPVNLKTLEEKQSWLNLLVEKANEAVTNQVKDGGTTLSVILAVGAQLMVAHVGDSRIYLLREGKISQLSEDHSLIAMLVASGQVTLEESLTHPDRNVLTKFLGSKTRLSDGYVQDLKRTTPDISLTLENGDTVVLCSDGVWDLVPMEELTNIFNENHDLQQGVNKTLETVLERGASDNATVVALRWWSTMLPNVI